MSTNKTYTHGLFYTKFDRGGKQQKKEKVQVIYAPIVWLLNHVLLFYT